MSKQNCWEFLGCGREEGGRRTDELGVCPAAIESRLGGVNSGTNGGRACWALSQTLCGDRIQGNLVDKMARCMECEFRKVVLNEEGGSYLGSRQILEILQTVR